MASWTGSRTDSSGTAGLTGAPTVRDAARPDGRALPCATALKQAQQFVREHTNGKWIHPRYWAAWQLWGLPD